AAQDAPRDTTPRGRGLAALDSAAARAAGGRYEPALAAYDSAAALLPTIAGWINLHAARAAAAQGDTIEVARRPGAAGATIAREQGWDLGLRALEEAGVLEQAIEEAKGIAAGASGARKASALTPVGRLRLLRGDTTRAKSALREALDASSSA